jgi:asparagine synthase (glutamine-hydrolysing)
MCGIHLYIQGQKENEIDIQSIKTREIIEASMTIKPRGPENTIINITDNYIMSFHRLAIQNTSIESNQPYMYIDKEENYSYYLLCNGEIYNYKELIEEYELNNKSSNIYIKNDCDIIYPLFNHFNEIEKREGKVVNKLNNFINVNEILNGEYSIVLIEINNRDKNNQIENIFISTDHCSVRPLFNYFNEETNTIILSSLLKGITKIKDIDLKNHKIERLNGYDIYHYKLESLKELSPFKDEKQRYKLNKYSYKPNHFPYLYDVVNVNTDKELCSSVLEEMREECKKINDEILYSNIVKKLRDGVIKRLHSDRPLGCLLSGGLDSSLVAAIASKELKSQGKRLRTFTIGMKNSTDSYYAKKVAEYIDSDHTEITITEEEALNSIEEVIKCCETYDITTIRASVGQYLISKWISKNTDIKVILNGDSSDELFAGYLYSHMSPNSEELQKDLIKLIENIHYFDGLRVDRNLSYHGLEARLPFIDKELVEFCKRLNGEIKEPKEYKDKKIEKYILRKAFDEYYSLNYNNGKLILPEEVLWRVKEAMSDGISKKEKSWYQIIQEWIEKTKKVDENKIYDYLPPISKESRWYREIFENEFGSESVNIIPYYWMPKWSKTNDPSARTLSIYKHE